MPHQKESQEESKPKKDHVKNTAAPFRIGEDFELAHRLQNGEFEEHFGLNRDERKTMRENLIAAKVIQNEEEYRLQQERLKHLQRLRSQEETDEEAARRYQRQLLEETARERNEEVLIDRQHAILEQERLLREADKTREEIKLLDEEVARREEARLRSEDAARDEAMARRVAADLKAQRAAELRERADNDANYARALFHSLRLEEKEEARRLADQDDALARSLSAEDQPGDGDFAQEMQDEEIARMLQKREIRNFRRRQANTAGSERARGRVFSDGDYGNSEPVHRSLHRTQSDKPHSDYSTTFSPSRQSPPGTNVVTEEGFDPPVPAGHTRRYERRRVVQRTENGRTIEERHRELEFTDESGKVHRQHHKEMNHYTGPRQRAPPPPPSVTGESYREHAEPPPLPPVRNGIPFSTSEKKSKKKKK